jgi:hypothetical protein
VDKRKTAVRVITVAMVLLGVGFLALGIALGSKLVLIALGVAMFFAAYLAYQSGMAYIEQLPKKPRKKKDE